MTWHYEGCLREESMAVFFLKTGTKKEVLLYDFGLKVGDQIPGRNTRVKEISRMQYKEPAHTGSPDVPEGYMGPDTPVDKTYNPRVFRTEKEAGGNKITIPACIEGIGDPQSDVLFPSDDKADRVLYFCTIKGKCVYNKWLAQ
jgi:hypothetical protein